MIQGDGWRSRSDSNENVLLRFSQEHEEHQEPTKKTQRTLKEVKE